MIIIQYSDELTIFQTFNANLKKELNEQQLLSSLRASYCFSLIVGVFKL